MRDAPHLWQVLSWCLISDGKNIGRAIVYDRIDHFGAEKKVIQLSRFPSAYCDCEHVPMWGVNSIKWGEAVYKLLQSGNKEMDIDGRCIKENNRRKVSYRYLHVLLYLTALSIMVE